MKTHSDGYRWMALLMICSQILLTGFVIYWINGQYTDAQLRLHAELKREYEQVHDQFIDSLLMMNLIIPSLDDSVTIEVHLEEKSPHLIQLSHGMVPRSSFDSAGPVVMIKQFSKEIKGDTSEQKLLAFPGIEEDERMVRSVRLFIKENKEVFQNDTGLFVFTTNQDTAALLDRMEMLLETRDWNFTLGWPEEDLGKARSARGHGIVLNGGPSGPLPDIKVKHFGGYLWVSIFPQVLFGLVLLILSASAFWFAFRSLKKQLALHQLRDDFIGNISHELKTPVSTVKITLEALRKYDLRKDAKRSDEYLDMASREMERLELLVGKVLQHDMLRNPSLVLEKTPQNLGFLIKNVLRTMEAPIRDCGADVSLSLGENKTLVNLDPIYMEGVLVNLLDNCLKYAGPKPVIELKISSGLSGISLVVKDNGPGIPDQYKKQVFDKFFRIPSGDRHDVKGYGLGLNFVSQVMTKHGGSIHLESHPGKGSVFTLHFPDLKE